MALPGDEAQLQARFSPFGDSDRCMVCAKRTIRLDIILDTPTMVLLGDGLKCKLDSVHLEIVLILTQDGCTVCVERTTGSEILLDARNENS
jgi:hypothetical protein